MPVKMSAKDVDSSEMRIPLLGGTGVGPAGNSKRAAVNPADSRETTEEQALSAAESSSAPSQGAPNKAKSYQDRLAAAGISLTQAREIADSVLFQGGYSRDVQLTPNFSIKLTSRAFGDTLRVMRVVEAEAPTFQLHISDIIARYNLAASLVRYGDIELPLRNDTDTEKDEVVFQERLDFVFKLPEVAVRRAIDALSKFDAELALIFSEGAIEDF